MEEIESTLSYHGEEGGPARLEPSALPPGTSVHRYIILERVGEGGMGVVYSAYDSSLDRRVAMKFLRGHEAGAGGVREERLLREAQALARLSHPNVVVAYDVGVFRGSVFLAMEFVDGVDLGQWLTTSERTAAEILDVFCAAGRGLAAAHAAGIVHRDFKPTNVLVDKQNRPRVTDFGLSRAAPDVGEGEPAAEDESETAPSRSGGFSTPLTRTGAILGTPSYMSPEQHRGDQVDERSDQFSFCVALYEALYRTHPFKAVDPTELVNNVLAGRVAPAPPQSSVPRWCRQALLRGLDPVPERRFASMGALLAALAGDPYRRRRQIVVGTVLGFILIGGAGYGLFFDRSAVSAGPRCDLGSERLAGVWDEPRKQQMRGAFLHSGASGVEATWKSLAAILDRRADAWVAMHNQACRATHVDGVQSASVLDLRMECLDRKLQEMKDLVDVFSEKPDTKLVDRAGTAAENLSRVSACGDIVNLRALVPLPDDPAARAKVASLRQQLSRSQVLYEAGRFEQARDQIVPLKREADALGYAPLVAEAARSLGESLSALRDLERAEELLLEAAERAVKGRDWTLEARAWVTLVGNYGRRGRLQEALVAAQAATLAIERANGDDALRASLLDATAWIEFRSDRYQDALRHYQQAEELWKASLGTRSQRFAIALEHIGTTLGTLGRIREAVDYLERSLAVRREILRPDHVDIASSLIALAQAYTYLGQYRKARAMVLAAHETIEKELGPEHPRAHSTLHMVAVLDSELGDHARALEIFEKSPGYVLDPHNIAGGMYYLLKGEIERSAGLADKAEVTLRRSIEHYAGAGFPDHANTAYPLTSLGFLHNERREFRQGLRECRRALALLGKEMDPKSHQLSVMRECIGEALIGTGDFASARRELELAVSSAKEGECEPRRIAALRFHLARALWPVASERPRARGLARSALKTLEVAEGDADKLRPRIEAWLAAHAGPS